MLRNNIIHLLISLVIFLALPFSSSADKADSLKLELLTSEDTTKVQVLLDLADLYSKTDMESAFFYANSALKESEKLENDYLIGRSCISLADLYNLTGELKEAIRFADRALNVFAKIDRTEGIAHSYQVLGMVNYRIGDYKKASDDILNALEYYRLAGNGAGQASCLNLLGIINDLLGNYEKALAFYKESENLSFGIDNRKGLAIASNNIGIVLSRLKRYDESAYYFNRAMKIYSLENNDRGVAACQNNLGIIEKNTGNYEKALEYYAASMEIKEKLQDRVAIAMGLVNIGEVYELQGRKREARKQYLEAISIAEELSALNVLKEAYKNISELDSKNGNSSEAYKYLKLYADIKDSLFSEQKLKTISEIEIRLETKELQDKIKLLETQNELSRLKARQDKIIQYVLIIGILIVLIFSVLLYTQFVSKRKANQKLARLNNDLNVANVKLIESEENLMELNTTKDKFFSIISHDLRNPFASMISFVRIVNRDINTMEKEEFVDLANDLGKTVDKTYNLLENLLVWSRSQTGRLKYAPSDIEISEFIESSLSLIVPVAKRKNIEIICNGPDSGMITADKNMMDTMLRNLVGNALKFTEPGGRIELNYSDLGDNWLFEIKDNGVGIDEESAKNLFRLDKKSSTVGTDNEIGSGLGLYICKEFAEKQGGRIWFESEAGKGTSFFFEIPKD